MKKEYPDILKLEGEKWQNPDPATGKLGTRVPAEWLQTTEDSLKSLTLEMLEVLKSAGINPNELNNTQVRDAIQKMILARVINYNDIVGRPIVKDSLGDDRNNPASQRVVNDVNRDVVTAQKTANTANDKANTAQNRADSAYNLANSKQDKFTFVGDGPDVMKTGAGGWMGVGDQLTMSEDEMRDFLYESGSRIYWNSIKTRFSDAFALSVLVRVGKGFFNISQANEKDIIVASGNKEVGGEIVSKLITNHNVTSDLGESDTLIASQALATNISKQAFGISQKWQDVTKNRSLDAVYKNTTNRTIIIQITASYTDWGIAGRLTVEVKDSGLIIGSVTRSSQEDNARKTIGLITAIPAGESFLVRLRVADKDVLLENWTELR